MRFNLVRSTCHVAIALSPCLAAPVFAEAPAAPENAASQGDDLTEIVVTARRIEERLQDVPISITVLSEDAISKRDIYNAGDLGAYVPSLSSNANFGPTKSSFAIRGFTQEGKTSPSVAVYFADVVAPRANGGTTSGNGAGPGSLFDLQNIQVLKGPQGTLFGRNTTGGAILLVPAKPSGTFQGSIEGSAGDFGMHRVQGMLNVPLNDMFRVRGAFDWNQRDGYLINTSGIGPDRFGNTNYFAGRISLVADLTPNLENYTIGSYSRSHDNGVVPNLTACNTGTLPGVPPPSALTALLAPLACLQIAQQKAGFYGVENTDTHPYERTDQWQIINTTTWTATDTLTVKNIISYAEYKEAASFSLWGTNFQLPVSATFSVPIPTIQLDPGPSGYNTAQSTFTEELQLRGRSANDLLTWQAGGYLEVSNPLGFSSGAAAIFLDCASTATLQCNNPLGFGTISAYDIKDIFNNKGLYAQADYKLTDRLTTTAGFRYTFDRMDDDDRNVNIFVPTPGTGIYTCQNIIAFNKGTLSNPIPVVVESSTSAQCDLKTRIQSSRPTWLLDFDYKLTPDAMVYAKWSRGYRQGAINPNNLGFPTWGPETVDTYEVGSKTSWTGPVPGVFDFAAFYNDFRNQQLAVNTVIAQAYQGAVPPQQLIINAGKSRISGIEADASVKPFKGLVLDVAYAYLDTKLESFQAPALPVYYSQLVTAAQIGGPLSLAPKNRVSLTGTYTLPLPSTVGQVSFGATFTHTDANRALSPIASPLLYQIPAVNDLNLNADWHSVFGRPYDLSFFMTNVTNEHHILFPDGSWNTIGAEGGHPNLPRMFGFRVKMRFGS
jgi:iron complex outermembrane receptor protein